MIGTRSSPTRRVAPTVAPSASAITVLRCSWPDGQGGQLSSDTGLLTAHHRGLREDDLTTGGHGVELTDGDDVHDLFDQVVLGELEQIRRRLARVDPGTGVRDRK